MEPLIAGLIISYLGPYYISARERQSAEAASHIKKGNYIKGITTALEPAITYDIRKTYIEGEDFFQEPTPESKIASGIIGGAVSGGALGAASGAATSTGRVVISKPTTHASKPTTHASNIQPPIITNGSNITHKPIVTNERNITNYIGIDPTRIPPPPAGPSRMLQPTRLYTEQHNQEIKIPTNLKYSYAYK
jgi:hypothetical protein